jgi:hypothetical protein
MSTLRPPVLVRGETDLRSLKDVRSLNDAITLIVAAYCAFASCLLVNCDAIARMYWQSKVVGLGQLSRVRERLCEVVEIDPPPSEKAMRWK